jgi:hypothetical protein
VDVGSVGLVRLRQHYELARFAHLLFPLDVPLKHLLSAASNGNPIAFARLGNASPENYDELYTFEDWSRL